MAGVDVDDSYYHQRTWGCPWLGQHLWTTWMLRSYIELALLHTGYEALGSWPHLSAGSTLESGSCASFRQNSRAGPKGMHLPSCRGDSRPLHLAFGKDAYRARSSGKLALSLTSCSTQETWAEASPGKHRRHECSVEGTGEPAQRARAQDIWPYHSSLPLATYESGDLVLGS